MAARTGNARTSIQRGGLSGSSMPRGKGGMEGNLKPGASNARTKVSQQAHTSGPSIAKKPTRDETSVI